MPFDFQHFNIIDRRLAQNMGKNGLHPRLPTSSHIVSLAGHIHNDSEAEVGPWTITDSLALFTLVAVPVATAPLLVSVGVVSMIPVSGKLSHSPL